MHEPTTLEWTLKPSLQNLRLPTGDEHAEPIGWDTASLPIQPFEPTVPAARTPVPSFPNVEEFAKALNRLDRTALELAAGDPLPDMAVEGLAVRKLLATFWFRSIFPRLSAPWRERLLESLAGSVAIPNHLLWRGRQAVHLADGNYDDLKEIAAERTPGGAAGTDLQLVLAIAGLWGEDARRRLRFVDVAAPEASSRLGALLGFRR